MLPIHWFLDGTKVFNSAGMDQCFLLVSWSGCGAKGVSRKVKHFAMQVPEWRYLNDETNAELARFVGWLQRVLMGIAPRNIGYYGEPMDAFAGLPSPPRLYLGGLKTDWSQRKTMHHYNRYWRGPYICEHCDGRNRGACLYSDFRSEPDWAATQRSHANMMAAAKKVSPWFVELADCGLTKDRHHMDGLHFMYKRGCVSEFLGSLFMEWIRKDNLFMDLGVSEDVRLRHLFGQYAKWMRDGKISSHRLIPWNLHRLCASDVNQYPAVTDRYKCGDCKTMALWAAEKAEDLLISKVLHGGELTPHDRIRYTAATSLAGYIRTCSSAPALMEDTERLQALAHGQRFLECYSALAKGALDRNEFYYKVRPKFHQLAHVLRKLKLGDRENPRTHETWGEESLGGFLARLNRRCHGATVMLAAANRCVGALLSDLPK